MKDIQKRITRMLHQDEDNQDMFLAMDEMWEMDWNLPPDLDGLDWIRKEVSSDPHDAIRAGTRVLASIMPNVTLSPLVANRESREASDRIERALKWHFENANRRGNSPLFDMVKHAMLYDRVAVQVVYMPYQEKLLGLFNNEARKRASTRFGPYAFIVRNPKDVFVDYSDWMPERVVHRYTMNALELISFWGEENTSRVRVDLRKSKDDGKNLFYTVYDYNDYERRLVFACRQDAEYKRQEPEYHDPIKIIDEEMDLPFLPWVVRSGGRKLTPMLYSIYKTNQWTSQNVFETIMSSEVIAYAAAPRGVVTSANPDLIETEYGDPNRDKKLRPGDEYEQLRPPEIDANMQIMSDRIRERMQKSTVPNVIQTGDFPSGTAFATLNLATQSGVKAMAPYKRLAEDALADVFAHMLYWIDYTGDTIISYPSNPESPIGMGDVIEITPDDFDVDHLYIKVELTPDVPTDRMQRINAAVMANQNLLYSNRKALEDIGVTEPGAEIDQWYEEQTRRRDWELEQQQKNMQLELAMQLEGQKQSMSLQMQMQQMMASAQQGAGGGGTAPTMGEVARNPAVQREYARNRGRGFEATQNSAGFNPALGGNPPAMANPEGTRESQQGTNITSSEAQGAF